MIKDVLKKDKTSEIFKEYHLSGWQKHEYAKFNLIIGENGAGKSRFLSALRDSLAADGQLCVFLDFSNYHKLNDKNTAEHKENTDKSSANNKNLTGSLIYNKLLDVDVYKDLLSFIQKDYAAFFSFLVHQIFDERTKEFVTDVLLKINEYLDDILKRTLIIEDNQALIRNSETKRKLPISEAFDEMSPGENVLLLSLLAILSVAMLQKPFVLLIDEPETHLHPNALLKLIRLLCKDITPDYTFVASHSIFLLPQLEFEEIIFISNSTIAPISSRKYENIISCLIGGRDDSQSLYTFLTSLYHWEYSDFMAQCFLEPGNVDTVSTEDKQFLKLKKIIDYFCEENKPLRVLDYGSGSGRIAKCLALALKNDESVKIVKNLSYHIYDKYKISEDIPKEAWLKKPYRSQEELAQQKGNFDIILLFNVLHEINIEDWQEDLNFILSLLADGGYILFSERRVLARGESPYGKSGYLVLNEDEIKFLFLGANCEAIHLDDSTKDPTVCMAISEVKFVVSRETIRQAMKHLMERSWMEIRKGMSDAGRARSHAFYSQQYSNSKYAMEILNESPYSFIQDENLSEWTYADILNYGMNADGLYSNMKKRAEIDDENGEKCKQWLKEHETELAGSTT